MSEQIGALSVDLTADVAEYQRALRQATQTLEKSANDWSFSVAGARNSIQSMFAPLLALRTALGALAALGFALSIKEALNFASALQDASERTGVGVETLQAYRFAAMQAGMGMDGFNAALLKFAKNVGDARNGTGELVAGLRVTDRAFLELIRNAPTMEDALRAAFDKLAGIGDESRRAALASDLFGREGVKLSNIVKDGAVNVEALTESLRRSGHLMDEALVAEAEKAGDRLQALGLQVDVLKNRLTLGLLPVLEYLVQGWANLARALREKLAPTAEENFTRIGAAIFDVTRKLHDLAVQRAQVAENMGKGIPESLGGARLEAIDRETAGLEKQLEELKKSRDAILAETGAKRAAQAATKELAGARREDVQALKEQTYELQGNAELVAAIDAQLAAEAEESRKVAEEAREVGRVFTSAFEDAIVEGGNLRSILQGIYKDLLRLFIRRAITGPLLESIGLAAASGAGTGGGGSGDAGGFGGRAHGGPLGAGQMALVGEQGPELFVPRTSGDIVPNHALGGTTVVINAPGADGETLARLNAWGRQFRQDVIAASVAAGTDFRRRGGRG